MMFYEWTLYLHTQHAYFTLLVSKVELHSEEVILQFSINKAVSVSDKLTWLGEEYTLINAIQKW